MKEPRENQAATDQSLDTVRRRLTKAGLAAPAVLGALASRPVLADSLHHCTPSGHISGFASPNPNATPACSSLGYPPSHYRSSLSTWPGGSAGPFLNRDGKSRWFKNAPKGLSNTFADAYQIRRLSDNTVRDATLWDVLAGCNVDESTGVCLSGWVVEARSGFNSDLGLGAEAIAAAMNAYSGYPSGFPISTGQVVEMFNVVVSGGLYQVTSTNVWTAAEVKAYFQSLHS